MNLNVVGIDIAKNVFQVCWVDPDSGELVNRQVKRASLLQLFANRERYLIGMEACGGAQHWARMLIGLGHDVRIMAGKAVKAFVIQVRTTPRLYRRAIAPGSQRHGRLPGPGGPARL